MWRVGLTMDSSNKDDCFSELIEECKRLPPGSKLSYSLRSRLEQFPLETRRKIANRPKSGCASLFHACKRGQTEIVEYLISVCSANIEQRGLYEVPDERSVHYVTPLWCAAVSGKMSVIKCLLDHGANINAVSDTGSTPVRSACFMTHLEIVRYLVEKGADVNRANYNGGTCLINSVQSVVLCKYLLRHGADVNARDIQNKTALHYAIQEHRLETTKLLIKYGADPNAKSRYGDDALQMACLKGAAEIFAYLTEEFAYSSDKLVHAHELLGATCLDEHNNMYSAIHHWDIGLELRIKSGLLPKTPIMEPRAAFKYQVEFSTKEELEAVKTDLDMMRIHSLLITERILGPTHKDTIFRLMFRGASYIDTLRYQRCIDLWRRALEIRVEKDTILYADTCFTAQAIVRLLIDFNEKHLRSELSETNDEQRFEDVVGIFKLLTTNINEVKDLVLIRPVHKRQLDSFDKVLKCVTHLIYLLLQTAQTPQQKLLVKTLVTKLTRENPTTVIGGDSLLHLCVSKSNTLRSTYFLDVEPLHIFPKMDVVKYLLECGVDINSRNGIKATPLHIATTEDNYVTWLVWFLLDSGAHIDLPDVNGMCPAKQILAHPLNYEVFIMNFITLKCLCATFITNNKLPYKNMVPRTLEDFIESHQT